jgi:lipopolysaccharide/colanic/teichoic acid biosynthesis glycosyltransferase
MAAGHSNIRFQRGLSDEALFSMLRQAYAVLFTAFNEDWGLVPLEAMALGRPVIAVNRGGPRETILDGQTGFLAEPEPEAFSKAMERLADSPDLTEHLGRQARDRAAEFDWSEYVREIDNRMEEMAAACANARPRVWNCAGRIIKRAIDIAGAVLGLALLSPVMLLSVVLLWMLEGRPLFYISRRYVSRTRSMRVLKFRTMYRDAKSPKYRLEERFMRDGYLDIPRTCEVYTPIGRIIERFQIVELPQLWNVLFDGMSLIGNRPLPEQNVSLLKENHPNWGERFDSPAGITGIAQVAGKLFLDPAHRIQLEAAYSAIYRSGNILRCDALIFWYTLRMILTGVGVSPLDAFRIVELEPPDLGALEHARRRMMAQAAGGGK